MSHFLTRAVSLTADLAIPDLLAKGPRHAEDLARETKTEPRALGRTLRLVASAGILTETEPMRSR